MKNSSLRRVLRYMSHFGPSAGLGAARLHRRTGGLTSVSIPGIDHPLWARAGTADVETFEEVFVTRQYDVVLADFNPRHVLDLGANIGYASVDFSARWPLAQIVAVEPVEENLQLLRRNIAAWPNITAVHGAVWSRSARLLVANPHDAPNAYRMGEPSGPVTGEVPAYTVAQLMMQHDCGWLDLVKMDVEGAEVEIFHGNVDWLDRVGVLIVELHDRIRPGCAQAFYAALHGRRFTQEISGSNLVIDLR